MADSRVFAGREQPDLRGSLRCWETNAALRNSHAVFAEAGAAMRLRSKFFLTSADNPLPGGYELAVGV